MCRLLTLAVLMNDAATLRVRSWARVSRVEDVCRGALVVPCARWRRIIRPPPRLRSRPAGWVRRAAFALLLACVASGAYGASPGELCCPRLLSPEAGALLDNGRTDRRDDIVWTFSWTACPGADAYQLYVIGPTATVPVIDDFTSETTLTVTNAGAYIDDVDAVGWTWRVRARTGGAWGPWSESRTFDVEPVNTDPARIDWKPGPYPVFRIEHAVAMTGS